MHLDPPNLLALVHTRHLEQHVRADATLERRIEVRRKIGRKDDDAVERFELLEQHVDDGVRLAQEALLDRRNAATAMASASSNSSTAFSSRARRNRAETFFGVSPIHIRLHFGVAHDQQPTSERVRDGLGADRLPRPRRSGEVEGERETGRMPLAETPAIEDQVMTGDVDQRLVERQPRGGWEDYVLKRYDGGQRCRPSAEHR